MRWTTRDTLGCLIVPAIAAALCSAGSCYKSYEEHVSSERFPLLDGEVTLPLRFLFFFLSSLPVLLAFYLTIRLTFLESLASLRHRRILYTLITVSVGLTFASVLATVFNSLLLGIGIEIRHWEWFIDSALSGYSSDVSLLTQMTLCVAAQGILPGIVAAYFFAPSTPKHDEEPKNGTRNLIGALLCIAIPLMSIIPIYRRWSIEADRAGCILNIRNVQQAMRSYHGMNNQPLVFKHDIVGPGKFLSTSPICPGGCTYSWTEGKEMKNGELMLRCSDPNHIPTDYEYW